MSSHITHCIGLKGNDVVLEKTEEILYFLFYLLYFPNILLNFLARVKLAKELLVELL